MSATATRIDMPVADYYANPAVRARIREYCGATASAPPTAAFVAAIGPADPRPIMWEHATCRSASDLDAWLADGADLARSLWDAEHLIVAVDFDFENPDDPASPYFHPADTFVKLEPVYRAAVAVCRQYGLPLRATMTGRGYHFAGQVRLAAPVIDALARIAPDVPSWFAGVEARRPAGVTASLTARQARAATGLGCVIEFLAHLIRARAGDHAVPVVFNGTTVGHTSPSGREGVSIDFSYAGDPLDVRHMRVMFGAYQWHRFRPDIFGDAAADIPALAAVPRDHRPLLSLLTGQRALESASRMAGHVRAGLPDVSAGLARVLAAYDQSPLAAFHREYHAELGTAPRDLRSIDRARIPPCVLVALERPNDLLLRPEHVQHVVRALLSRGWTAAEVARLVAASYEADHEWGDRWVARMHPRTRAEFDVRVFAGMVATGADRLVDFNCVSAQEKQLCPQAGCHYDLRVDRDRLSARRDRPRRRARRAAPQP